MAFPKIIFQQKSLFANFYNGTVWQGEGPILCKSYLRKILFLDESLLELQETRKCEKVVLICQSSQVSMTKLEICFPVYNESSLKRSLLLVVISYPNLTFCTIFRLLASHRARHLFEISMIRFSDYRTDAIQYFTEICDL